MRFLWPDALWLLLLVPACVAGYLWALRRRKRNAVRYSSLELLREALGPGQRWRRHLPPALALVAVVLALLAAARPTATMVLPSERMTLALAMDVSRSMQATDVEPMRLTAAQEAARAFIGELPGHVRLGIVSFAGTAAVVQTPTDERDDMLAAIDRFQLQRGTATGSGLILALAMLFPEDGIDLEAAVFDRSFSRSGGSPLARDGAAPRPAPRAITPVAPGSYTSGAIILLSDGRRTTGPDPIEIAKMAADRGVRVYTVGFGTRQGGTVEVDGWSFYTRLDEDTLRAVAALTGGEYFHAGSGADLRKVYEGLSLKFAMEKQQTEIGALLSALAAVLLAVAVALSLRWFGGRAAPAR